MATGGGSLANESRRPCARTVLVRNRDGMGHLMGSVLMSQVGSIELLDLEVIGEFCGRNFLPYPFMFAWPTRFATQEEATAYTITVPDRFMHGDLQTFGECIRAYLNADIRVECHIQQIPADTPSGRVIAYRTGQLGFLAVQRSDADVVDFYTVSPYDLGAAIAETVPVEQPGRHPAIVIPEYVPPSRGAFDTEVLSINDRVATPTEVTVRAREVTAYATVQSHWRPSRKWGLDRFKSALVWTRIRGDGDYIYAPDGSHARPMTGLMLQDRIDRLIADDIALLKESRRD